MTPRADEIDVVQLIPLARPRPLTVGERALLDALVEPLGLPELAKQAARAKVVTTCSCGCPSVGLSTTGPALTPQAVSQLDPIGHDDISAITAYGVNPEGREVEVTLHIVFGSLKELEIWAGWDGGEVETELPSVESLRPQRPD